MGNGGVPVIVGGALAVVGGESGSEDTVDSKLGVSLSAPADGTFSNGTVDVQIAVTGGRFSSLQLLVDDEVFATVGNDGKYAWDTSGVDEGEHEITARVEADGDYLDSASRTVTIDRTPPKIIARAPDSDAPNVFIDDAIRVEFSEQVLDSTAAPGVVTLSANGKNVACTPTLSKDKRTLTLQVDGTLPVPTTVSATLGTTLTDLAGNSLVAEDTWAWQLPSWINVGGKVKVLPGLPSGTCGLGAAREPDRPAIVIVQKDGTSSAYVLEWDGHDWQPLGGAVNPVAGHDVANVSMSRNAQGPVLLIQETDGTKTSVYVQQWDGSSWVPLGGALNPTGAINLASSSIEGYGDSGVVIAIAQSDSVTINLYNYSWSGSAWTALGPALNAVAGQDVANRPVIRVNASGQPVIAFNELDGTFVNTYVRQWDGTAWTLVGGPLNSVTSQHVSSNPQLALTTLGRPVVGFAQKGGPFTNLYVSEWSTSGWKPRGPAVNAVVGQDTTVNSRSFALTSTDTPIIAFRETNVAGTLTDAYVQKLVGASWSTVGELVNPSGQNVSQVNLTLDSKDRPIVAISQGSECYVMRANKL